MVRAASAILGSHQISGNRLHAYILPSTSPASLLGFCIEFEDGEGANFVVSSSLPNCHQPWILSCLLMRSAIHADICGTLLHGTLAFNMEFGKKLKEQYWTKEGKTPFMHTLLKTVVSREDVLYHFGISGQDLLGIDTPCIHALPLNRS